MTILNIRAQRPVGQGFFHAGWIKAGEAPEGFFYVYDCGAMATYKAARDREIRKLINDVGTDARLDLLVLSHMHADHVNGVEKLISDGKFAVDTVMMPLVRMKDRLVAFAKSAAEDPASAGSAFYRSFIANPVEAMSRFEPRNILLVRRGEGGSPGSGTRDDAPLDGDPGTSGEGRGYGWKLVGQGTAEPAGASPAERRATIIPDTSGIRVSGFDDWEKAWLLAPFVDQSIALAKDGFLAKLAASLGLSEATLEVQLDDPNFVLDLLSNRANELKGAYKACHHNLNLTSLCLFSGPLGAADAQSWHKLSHSGWSAEHAHGRLAWLATGDANLNSEAKCDALLDHFAGHLEKIVTVTMPHHGSDLDFHERLLEGTSPAFGVVAADAIKDWQHPGAVVTRALASHGALIVVTNSQIQTLLTELAQF
jgi:hypothetical protein